MELLRAAAIAGVLIYVFVEQHVNLGKLTNIDQSNDMSCITIQSQNQTESVIKNLK